MRRSRETDHPLVFAAAEAAAAGAEVGLVMWEMAGKLHYRTVPAMSVAVLEGLHTLLTAERDKLCGDDTEGGADDDAEA